MSSVAIISNNLYLVSGSHDKTVRVLNLLEKREEVVFNNHNKEINSLAITCDDCYVVSADYYNIIVENP